MVSLIECIGIKLSVLTVGTEPVVLIVSIESVVLTID